MVNSKRRVKHVQTSGNGISEDTKAIITVLLLIFAAPFGYILMLFWTKWPRWVKFVITIPVLVLVGFIALVFSALIIEAMHPSPFTKNVDCVEKCKDADDKLICTQNCVQINNPQPTQIK